MYRPAGRHLYERRPTCALAVSTPGLCKTDLIHDSKFDPYIMNSIGHAKLVAFIIHAPPPYLFYACTPYPHYYSR